MQPQPVVQPQPVAEPAKQSEPTPEPSNEDGSPGVADDRAADASSLPSEVRRAELGRVLAGEGLRIQTTRLVLTDLQRYLGRPPNPLVEISFGRDGTVVRAAIARGQARAAATWTSAHQRDLSLDGHGGPTRRDG